MNAIKRYLHKLSNERKLISLFREAGATTFDLASDPKDFEDIKISVFNKMIRKKVLERADMNRYFLNERELLKYRMEKSKWGMILLLAILGAIILFFNK